MGEQDRATPEERLRAGQWLSPGEVAALLQVDRRTIDRMLRADPPVLRYRVKPGLGRHREVNPEDVRRERAKRQTVLGDAGSDG